MDRIPCQAPPRLLQWEVPPRTQDLVVLSKYSAHVWREVEGKDCPRFLTPGTLAGCCVSQKACWERAGTWSTEVSSSPYSQTDSLGQSRTLRTSLCSPECVSDICTRWTRAGQRAILSAQTSFITCACLGCIDPEVY